MTVLRRLACGQDGLDEDADVALGGVPAPHNGEAEGLFAVALLEDDSVQRVAVLLMLAMPSRCSITF